MNLRSMYVLCTVCIEDLQLRFVCHGTEDDQQEMEQTNDQCSFLRVALLLFLFKDT